MFTTERTTLGRKIIDHQGPGFLLADMAAVRSHRPTICDAVRLLEAERLIDVGLSAESGAQFREAESIVAAVRPRPAG